MTTPIMLDGFCGAGGSGEGFHRAGFEVVGVDIDPQPNYPFEFIRGDFLELAPELLASGRFVCVHAAPPCQAYTRGRVLRPENAGTHPELIEPVREILEASGLPYVIENVPGAPLIDPVMLCGTSFGLGAEGFELRRHRLFECNFPLMAPGPCMHRLPSLPVFGHTPNADFYKRNGGRAPGADAKRAAMGIDWMNRNELSESIPPAYTEFIGEYLLQAVLDRTRAAA